ncbi:MAG: ABC transporter permease [Peptoniphilaceae bacterium]|jgi:lipoprotein-releasing system permease protein
MRLAFSIALRFLRSSKGQTFLIALGIAIGVSVQIFIGSLIEGLQIDLVDTTIGRQSQITVTGTKEEERIADYASVIDTIQNETEGVEHVSPVAEGQALIHYADDNYSIFLRGLDFAESEGIYGIEERLTEGALPTAENEILIGKNLLEDTEMTIGEEVEILTNVGEPQTAVVTGVFDLENANLNSTWILSTMETAQTLFDYGEEATSIEMQVTDVFAADQIAQQIRKVLSDKVEVSNWKDDNQALLSGLEGQSYSSYMIQIFVMISVLLGIASVLAITVVQKSRQIGILKAMGIRDGASSLIFLFQGMLLGIAGAVLGIALGLGLTYAFSTFALNPDGTPIVPLYINPNFIALSAAFAIVVSTLASLIPARKSSKLDPIEVIRNG